MSTEIDSTSVTEVQPSASSSTSTLTPPSPTTPPSLIHTITQIKVYVSDFLDQFPLITYPDENQTSDEDSTVSKRYTLFLYPPVPKLKGGVYTKKYKFTTSYFPQSLKFQTLARMSQISDTIDEEFTLAFQKSPTDRLPFILTPEGKPLVDKELVKLLLQGPDSDVSIDDSLDLETRALLHLIESTLGTAVLYFLFLDPEHFNSVTQHYLSGDLIWPVNFLSGYLARQKVTTELLLRNDVLIQEEILMETNRTLTALEERLSLSTSNPKKFADDVMASNLLDATVFAHYHVIGAAFPSGHPLKDMSLEFSGLREHSVAIFEKYYS